MGQSIKLESIELRVKELEPYNICFINNTDLEVEFDIPPEPELLPKPLIDKETIVNNNEETLINTEPECTKLTRKQLREARLKFYSGLKL